MNHDLKFPLNFIEEERSFLFWLALNSAKEYRDSDPELSAKWMKIVFNQFDMDESLFDDVELSLEVETSTEWIYGKYEDQLKSIDNASKSISKILNHHKSSGFEIDEDSSELTPNQAFGYLLALLLLKWQINESPDEIEKPLIDLLSDKNIQEEIKNKKGKMLFENRKGIRVLSIFQQVKKQFPKQSDHFTYTLAGYIGVSFGIYLTEEEHNDSDRAGTYRSYLRQNTKSLINSLK